MKAAKPLLEGAEIGDVVAYRNMAFVPVFGENVFLGDVLLVDQAFGREGFTVADSPSGSARYIQIRNDLEVPVFVPAGATFEGPTQNRASKYPAVVSERTSVERFPVHCVQRGRPTRAGAGFTGSPGILVASARSGETHQHGTWDTVSDSITSLGLRSGTEDYTVVDREADLGEYLEALGKPRNSQRGYVVAVRNNGNFSVYSDVFGNHELFKGLYDRLHRSVAVAAKQRGSGDIQISKDQFRSFLEGAREAEWERRELGESIGEIYVTTNPFQGTVLLYKNKPVQLSARK